MLSPPPSIGSGKDVGRAQSKPMPSSHDTSTMRLPGAKRLSSSRVTNINGAPVSCSTQLTTMSCSARKDASGTGRRSSGTWQRLGSPSSCSKRTMRAEWIGEATALTARWVRTSTSFTPCALRAVTAPRPVAPKLMTAARSRRPSFRSDRRGDRIDGTMGQDVDVIHAVRVEGRHRAPASSPEADDRGPQPPAILARRPDELQGMQHRAVTGQLVVLVKDVQAERTIGRPVIHRLEGDQRQPAVDADLGDLLVLDAMRPAPQHLSLPPRQQVLWLRLGKQDDIAFRDELVTRAKAGDKWRQLFVRNAETVAVTALEIDTFSQVSLDPLELQRMDRQPALVLLP